MIDLENMIKMAVKEDPALDNRIEQLKFEISNCKLEISLIKKIKRIWGKKK